MIRYYHLVILLALLLPEAPLVAGSFDHSTAQETSNAFDAISTPTSFASDSILIPLQQLHRAYGQCGITKKPGPYSITDWRDAIDSTWGMGLPKQAKLQIFDAFWQTIDEQFACFNNVDINWDSLGTLYRNEIVNGDTVYGVSRGRFAAIMNHLSLALQEAHSVAVDVPVSTSDLVPGIPLMVVGGWGDNGHFGAGLTPLADSSLLVYKARPDHLLGLVPGDIVLGYDGIPWKQLVEELLETEFPFWGWWVGSCDRSIEHSFLMAAGMNWHLFDTLDVVKYTTGDTLHLSTSPMENNYSFFWASEQLPVADISIPVYPSQYVSYGVINETQIGYVYVNAWVGTAGTGFYNALHDLITNQQVQALILDFRTNYGGSVTMSNAGLQLLFHEDETTIDLAVRNDPLNHYSMQTMNQYGQYIIHGDSSNAFDGPIAVLVGPGTWSAGEQIALRYRYHPRARIFGKTTTTSFNFWGSIDLGNPDWVARYAVNESFIYPFSGQYLTHIEFAVDEPVWFTPDMVA